MKIGFAGAGNMAAAMARGWAGAEPAPELMLFTDSGSGRAERLAEELGGVTVPSLGELAAAADVIVLAVKPAALERAAGEIRRHGGAVPVVSVLGATSLATLEEAFGDRLVIRTMPSIAAEVRRATICHAPPEPERAAEAAPVLSLLAQLGTLVELEDGSIDAATAVMGCAPAYVALVAEALISAGAGEGLEDDLAHELVVDTLSSTAELLHLRTPEQVRNAVASPGGSTEAGLDALEAAGVAEGFADAVRASIDRMRG